MLSFAPSFASFDVAIDKMLLVSDTIIFSAATEAIVELCELFDVLLLFLL